MGRQYYGPQGNPPPNGMSYNMPNYPPNNMPNGMWNNMPHNVAFNGPPQHQHQQPPQLPTLAQNWDRLQVVRRLEGQEEWQPYFQPQHFGQWAQPVPMYGAMFGQPGAIHQLNVPIQPGYFPPQNPQPMVRHPQSVHQSIIPSQHGQNPQQAMVGHPQSAHEYIQTNRGLRPRPQRGPYFSPYTGDGHLPEAPPLPVPQPQNPAPNGTFNPPNGMMACIPPAQTSSLGHGYGQACLPRPPMFLNRSNRQAPPPRPPMFLKRSNNAASRLDPQLAPKPQPKPQPQAPLPSPPSSTPAISPTDVSGDHPQPSQPVRDGAASPTEGYQMISDGEGWLLKVRDRDMPDGWQTMDLFEMQLRVIVEERWIERVREDEGSRDEVR
ncbi:hypothetical protein EG329_004977 [Mollisiaceae sp. DMI_Dod_QoI]|nr:hypothetical protein EG329_004977 [Helotiales sp. DMI_Dod_QoI]